MMKYAIFDLDGTLLDSSWVWENIDIDYLARYDKVPTPEIRERIKLLSVRQSAEFIKTEFMLASTTDEIIEEVAQMGEGKYEFEVMLKPGVMEYLQYLKNSGIKMCIATASNRKNAILALTRLGVYDFFEFMIATEDVKTGKDSPEIFLMCAERLGGEPKDTVVFEDSLHAMETAKSAGFKVAGIYDEHSENEWNEIKKICDYCIENFNEPGEIF